MERQEFLYYLFSESKLPYYKAANGQVMLGDGDYKKSDGQPASLQYSPAGWADTAISFVRNEKYWGLFRSMTSSMKFVKDGAEILRNRYHNGASYEEVIYMAVMRMDRMNLPYSYLNWYLTEIDFSKYSETSSSVSVEAIDGGLVKEFKANEDIRYEIPVGDNPNFVRVLMDGKQFSFNRKFAIVGEQDVVGTDLYYLGMVEISNEGQAPELQFFSVYPKSSSPYPNDDYFLRTDKVQEITVSGTLNIHFEKSVGLILRVETDDGTGGTGGFPQYPLGTFSGLVGEDKTFSFSETFTIPVGQRCHMKIYGGNSSDPTVQFKVTGGDISVDYVYRYQSTYIKGLYPWDLAEALVRAMTNNKYGIQSTWLAAKKDIVYTSSDNLRGIEFNDSDPENIIREPFIKISFTDFFKSLKFAGVSAENDKLIIEQLDYFFASTTTLDLGEVSEAEISTSADLGFNVIKAGYAEQQYEDVNGKYEVNQGQEWKAPVNKILEILDLRSPVRADSLGIELTRINFEGKVSTDSGDSESDTFMLNVGEEIFNNGDFDYVKLYRAAYSSVKGLPYWESSFNTELRPRAQIVENGPLIKSIFDQLTTKDIVFSSADKNAELETTLGSTNTVEKSSINISSLGDKLFQFKFINVKSKIPVNLLELINSNPYGKVKFQWNNRSWYGYIWEASFKPASNEAQTWKLLSAPENNLSLFNKF